MYRHFYVSLLADCCVAFDLVQLMESTRMTVDWTSELKFEAYFIYLIYRENIGFITMEKLETLLIVSSRILCTELSFSYLLSILSIYIR